MVNYERIAFIIVFPFFFMVIYTTSRGFELILLSILIPFVSWFYSCIIFWLLATLFVLDFISAKKRLVFLKLLAFMVEKQNEKQFQNCVVS